VNFLHFDSLKFNAVFRGNQSKSSHVSFAPEPSSQNVDEFAAVREAAALDHEVLVDQLAQVVPRLFIFESYFLDHLFFPQVK
jgi:hypothetical protein